MEIDDAPNEPPVVEASQAMDEGLEDQHEEEEPQKPDYEITLASAKQYHSAIKTHQDEVLKMYCNAHVQHIGGCFVFSTNIISIGL